MEDRTPRTSPMPQPGAVIVILMSILFPPSSRGSILEEYASPRSTILTVISGSKIVQSIDHHLLG
jgi:hypothetical protein